MLDGGEGLGKVPQGSCGGVHAPHGGFSGAAAPLGFAERGVCLICNLPGPSAAFVPDNNLAAHQPLEVPAAPEERGEWMWQGDTSLGRSDPS